MHCSSAARSSKSYFLGRPIKSKSSSLASSLFMIKSFLFPFNCVHNSGAIPIMNKLKAFVLGLIAIAIVGCSGPKTVTTYEQSPKKDPNGNIRVVHLAIKSVTPVFYNYKTDESEVVGADLQGGTSPMDVAFDAVGNGYVLIRTSDNIVGYVKGDELSADMSSCEPDLHLFKLVVADISKRVMSHASNGTLIAEVNMNTVLYADVKRDGVYQVQLPNGESGWISSSGVIELGINEETAEVGVRYFVSSVLTMVNATYLDGGVTNRGISIQGLAYVAAGVNGVPIPRELKDQIDCGTEVKLEYDVVTGELLIDSIIPGDIVFLSDPYRPNSREPYESAICTNSGVLLMRSKTGTSIKLCKFDADSELVDRIITVRRVFS